MAEPKEIWPTDEISAAVVDMTQKVSEEPDAYLHFCSCRPIILNIPLILYCG